MRAGRAQRFPRFEFVGGRPRPVIGEILKRLPENATSWQIAFWFRGENGWLDGRSPEDALGDRASVLMAAGRLRETTFG